MKALRPDVHGILLALFALFITAVLARPLMPVDETRYMTVAWEMYLRADWLAPLTVNFEPYHHKPPMLFWLINLSWSIFGVSRAAAIIPIALIAAANFWLTRELAKILFPKESSIAANAPFLFIGSAMFLVYGTVMMFDTTLSAFILGVFISMFRYIQTKRALWIGVTGLLLGCAVLTKGPVAYLYVLCPMLLAPFWLDTKKISGGAWYLFFLAVVVLSTIPILLWLVPVLRASDNDFAVWLIWNQTAGRITGNFSSSHARPIYFYLPLIPALFVPWILFPSFWKNIKNLKENLGNNPGLQFLTAYIVPVVIAFSLISGKQAHYMIPLLPACVLLSAWLLRKADPKRIMQVSAAFIIILIAGHAIAAQNFLNRYDLSPVVSYVHEHREKEWAFVYNYNGELGFLARLEKPMANLQPGDLKKWFREHPDGLAVIRFKKPEEVAAYKELMTMRYRGRNIGVFAKK